MDRMIEEPPVRTAAQSAKLWSTVAMWLYIAWITAEVVMPLARHVFFDAHYVVNAGLSMGARAALAAALRSLFSLVIDRLAPTASPRPPASAS